MAAITASMVSALREKTGVGMMDCKAALAATNGDMEAAVDWLRAKGLAKAAKKSTRVAAEGLVGIIGAGSPALDATGVGCPDSFGGGIPAPRPGRTGSGRLSRAA